MHNISIVYQKELRRVFTDKKLVFSLFILPVIMVVLIYGLMGFLVQNVMQDQADHVASVAVYQMPKSFLEYVGDDFFDTYEVTELQSDSEVEKAKDQILDESLDLLLVFNADFDAQITAYQAGDEIPDIHTFYNPSSDYSQNARDEMVMDQLEPYRETLLEKRFEDMNSMKIFTIDENNEDAEIQNEDKAAGEAMGAMLPYLITLLLFAGGMSVGIDMIAGEKERGTLASLLITPVSRSTIVLGKLFAMMTLSGISAIIYVVSMVIAIPLLMNSIQTDLSAMGNMGSEDLTQTLGMSMTFQPWQIWMMILIIVTMVFVYVAVIALTSVFAKDMKEASTYVTPVYLLVMMSGMVTMFTGDKAGTGTYMIPLYGAVVALKNILGQNISILNCLLCVLSHLVVGGILVVIVAKAFDSERVMFDA